MRVELRLTCVLVAVLAGLWFKDQMENAESRLATAMQARDLGQIDTAIKLFDSFLGDENPKHCIALTELAALLAFKQRFDDAVPIFETALEHCKGAAKAAPLHKYASALLRQARGDDAATESAKIDVIQLLKECQEISPSNKACHEKLASITN
jgi:tetratricopeptide (TPR) repeat protein